MGQLGLQLVGPVDATRARFLGPPSVRISSPPSFSRSLNAGVLGPFAPGSRKRMRPALIRCTWRTSSPSSVGKRCLPRRRAPANRRPSRDESGGSNVFRVATCAGPALATGTRAIGSSSVCRAASTSGNSGIVFLLVDALNVAVTRGQLVESRHARAAVVVQDGDVVEAWGDPELVAPVRSAAKPLQALPLVPYGLPAEELAIACASHARPEQLVAVRALMERAGVETDDLECGAEHGSRLRHNCSGKHAGFLYLCRERGWETAGYRLPEHPLQQELLALVAETVGRPASGW